MPSPWKTAENTDPKVVERHRKELSELPDGTTIYCIGKPAASGVIRGGMFFVVDKDRKIVNITAEISSVTSCAWNTKTGILKTNAVSDVVDCLGLRLHYQGNYFRFELLCTI